MTDDAAGPRVDAAADELYGLPQGEFTQARTRLSKQARADGLPGAAREIQRLGKPVTPAWFANQLARHRRADVTALIELGSTLRDATAALDATKLRELSNRQRRAVGDLVDAATGLGEQAAVALNSAARRALEDTLHAALADPECADQLQRGRLVAPLASSGFPGLSGGDWTAMPSAAPRARGAAAKAPRTPADTRGTSAKAKAPRTSADTTRKRRAELDRLRAESKAAAKAGADANKAVTAADKRLRAADDELARAEAAVTDARRAQAEAQRAHRKAVRAAADADRLARTARRRWDERSGGE